MIARPELFRGRVFPAVPTPLDPLGRVHRGALDRLIGSMGGLGIGGVAAWAPIGRGVALGPERRAEVFGAWRAAIGPARKMIAWVGATESTRRPSEVIEATGSMADEAARLGADALLVQPPGPFRGRADRDRLVLDYHAEIAGRGLPILVSYRREADGGVAYGPDVLAQLLARAEVLGVEIATIDGIATFQQIAALAREQAPEKLVVSGEERFLGYSLMSGADTAIVGIAAADPSTAIGLLEAHNSGDAARFLKMSQALDALARPIFRAPMDGSAGRLLESLVHRGILPPGSSD